MKKLNQIISKGFSLLEMLLVLVVMASILLLITNFTAHRMDQYRIDRTSAQIQQILNAGLSYYVTNGAWPTMNNLTSGGYLPSMTSPYGGSYTLSSGGPNTSLFQVAVTIPSNRPNDAIILAGELPVASVNTSTNTVTAQVAIPSENLNNARSVNFGAVYHSGGCVPQPTCPAGMTAQIIVAPAGVSGVFDPPTQSDGVTACSTSNIYNTSGGTSTTGNCSTINTYPITSFDAYVTVTSSTANSSPPSCDGTVTASQCYSDASSGSWTKITTGKYWRVCLVVNTIKGNPASSIGSSGVGSSNNQNMFWSQAQGYVFAFTRCSPGTGTTEPSGSSINVWSN